MNPDAKNGRLSDTPETDKARADYQRDLWNKRGVTHCTTVPMDFARRLERERDEARAIAKYWQEQYGHSNPEHEWQALPWETF